GGTQAACLEERRWLGRLRAAPCVCGRFVCLERREVRRPHARSKGGSRQTTHSRASVEGIQKSAWPQRMRRYARSYQSLEFLFVFVVVGLAFAEQERENDPADDRDQNETHHAVHERCSDCLEGGQPCGSRQTVDEGGIHINDAAWRERNGPDGLACG